MVNLDATDRLILDRLQANSDINIKELASELNLTKTPVYERIKRLEKETKIDVKTLNVSEFVKSIKVKQSMIIHDKDDQGFKE